MWIAWPLTKTHNRVSKLPQPADEESHDTPDLCESDPAEEDDACKCCGWSHSDEEDDRWTLPSIQTPSSSGACGSREWIREPRPVAILEKAPRDPELHAKLLNAIAEGAAARRKGVRIIVGSGACDHVAPKSLIKGAKSTKGKAYDENYVGADRGMFPNLGEQRLRLNISGKSTTAKSVAATFQLADIAKPVLSVSRLTENGCDVKFTSKGGMSPTSSGMKMPFHRTGGVYVLTTDIEPWASSSVVSAVTTPKKGNPLR